METVIAADRAEWRRWLAKNFARCDEIWLVFYRKAVGKPGVSYDHAVDDAGGAEGVQLRRRPGSSADARGTAERT